MKSFCVIWCVENDAISPDLIVQFDAFSYYTSVQFDAYVGTFLDSLRFCVIIYCTTFFVNCQEHFKTFLILFC